jgi:hypothetical protein
MNAAMDLAASPLDAQLRAAILKKSEPLLPPTSMEPQLEDATFDMAQYLTTPRDQLAVGPLATWLKHDNASMPLAFANDGKAFYIDSVSSSGDVNLVDASTGGPLTVGLPDFVANTRYLQRRRGLFASTLPTATGEPTTVLRLDPPGWLTFLNATGNPEEAPLELLEASHGPGATAKLLALAMPEPVIANMTYVPPPQGYVYFSRAPGSGGAQLMKQGVVGDCWFDAVVASMLHRNQGDLEALVQPSHLGLQGYTDITVYNPTNEGPRSVQITVSDRLPRRDDGIGPDAAILDSAGIPQIGPCLLEKGVAVAAQRFGWAGPGVGYEALDGNDSNVAMRMLTGKDAVTASTDSPDDLWDLLSEVHAGKLVVLSTPPEARVPGENFVAPGIVKSHAYSVLDIAAEGPYRAALLRNPWGHTAPDGHGGVNAAGDGTFWYPLDKIFEHFLAVSIGG